MWHAGGKSWPGGLGLLAALVGFAACAPKIQSFQVRPRRACAGDTVNVVWRAGGDVRLETKPDLPAAGPVARAGSLRVAVQDSTLFRLRIGKTDAYREQGVAVFAPGVEKTIALRTRPLGDTAVVAAASPPVGQWDSLVVIGAARSLAGRPLHVEHAGRSATLPADSAPSEALRGLPMAGSWSVTAPLIGGEVMGDTAHPPPGVLHLGVRLICSG